jgi:hypothetical protein
VPKTHLQVPSSIANTHPQIDNLIFKNRPSDIDDHDRAIYRFPSFLDWQDCYVHPNTLVPRELPAKDKLATRDLGSYRLTVDNQDEAVPRMGVEHVIVEEGIIVIKAKNSTGVELSNPLHYRSR